MAEKKIGRDAALGSPALAKSRVWGRDQSLSQGEGTFQKRLRETGGFQLSVGRDSTRHKSQGLINPRGSLGLGHRFPTGQPWPCLGLGLAGWNICKN